MLHVWLPDDSQRLLLQVRQLRHDVWLRVERREATRRATERKRREIPTGGGAIERAQPDVCEGWSVQAECLPLGLDRPVWGTGSSDLINQRPRAILRRYALAPNDILQRSHVYGPDETPAATGGD